MPSASRVPRLSPDRMYDRLLASDSAYNGRFFVGVTSTGIYCLPSCRARKPKRENVTFFPSCEAARESGFRPCRKCHPDDFARGADPVLESMEALVDEIRSDPARFADARAIVRRSGFGTSRLFELVRLHYHETPAELLLRARLDAAKRLLASGDAPLLDVAGCVGFESASSFHEQFRRRNGLTPAAYRELAGSRAFELQLPPGYALAYLRRALGRDEASLTDRLQGDHYRAAVNLDGAPALLELRLAADRVRVAVSRGSAFGAHAIAVGLLGLDQDAAGFARLARKLGLARLVAGREEMRISRTLSVFDALVWSILGQQITFAFACTLRRRLVERVGRLAEDGLFAPPTAEDVASLSVEELLPLKFSRSKAGYLIGAARLVARRELDLEGLRAMSATRAERTLLAIRGLGPWSVNYLMMRALGFMDCVPYGDTGVTSGLQALLKLETRPDIDATRRLMSPFSPYRSLATAHLWQFNRPTP